MDVILIDEFSASPDPRLAGPPGAGSFLWLDATHDEVAANPEAWREAVAHLTGVALYDPHLSDVVNLKHPSYFDPTQEYQLLVFRKLALAKGAVALGAPADAGAEDSRRMQDALKLPTMPVSFLLMDQALVTVREAGSRTIETARKRLLEAAGKPNGTRVRQRQPASPRELALRLLNAMVDQYLELRQPLTQQIERWQRALFHPRRPFQDWSALLDARNVLHKLDHLCEEQHDALQELRDHFIDAYHDSDHGPTNDLLLVRIHDVMEHITRVLTHARRLETSLESAVQLHFSAMAHRTSEIMRTLTVITALFMPLTLITGIFGMNFSDMPLLKLQSGFWITMGIMCIIVVGMLFFFRRKRYLEDRRSGR